MPTGGAAPLRESSLHVVIVGLMLAMSLPAFDLLILATASRAISEDIGGNVAWMFISFQITLVASMPLYGKLGDIYGRKRTFQLSIVLFVLASAGCGLVTSSTQLIIGRALQGAAGGGITGQTQAVLADIVPPRERGRVAWVAPTVWVVAGMSGPFLGGFFVDQLSWRWIFFVNIPLGLLAFTCIGYGFRAVTAKVQRSVDYLGALLIVAAVSLLSFVASAGGDLYDWTSPIIVLLGGIGLACSWLFVLQERRAPEPLFPLHLARDRMIRVCVGTTFCIGAANFGIAIFLPLFQQIVNGASATRAGLTVLPTSVGIVVSTTIVGKVVTRTGKYRWYPVVGVSIFTVGIYLLSILERGTPDWQVYASTFVVGLGSGTASPIIMIAMQNSVRHEDLGVVSSLAMFSRTIGQVFGPALGSSLLIARFGSYVRRAVDPVAYDSLGLHELRPESKPIGALAEPVHSQAVDAFRHAVNDSFRLATVFAVLGVLIAVFMRSSPLRGSVRTEPLEPLDVVR
jgi:EmrB/QacA subfamily drug resistance transporter